MVSSTGICRNRTAASIKLLIEPNYLYKEGYSSFSDVLPSLTTSIIVIDRVESMQCFDDDSFFGPEASHLGMRKIYIYPFFNTSNKHKKRDK